tara:strand:- start:1344 stop:2009 length:666 start_codon:yes stop_codon:yes gene_type:complete
MMDKFQGQFAIPKWNEDQVRIGLTGGIASGKSSVGEFLKNSMNLPILDADIYTHEILSSKSIYTDKIIQRFGKAVIAKDGGETNIINRKKLAAVIFQDKAERVWLEDTLHPIIQARIEEEINNHTKSNIIILIVPLLFEAKLTSLCNQLWVVNCSLEQQKERLMKRDNLKEEEAIQRVNSQLSLKDKVKMADVVINNAREFNSWEKEVIELISSLKKRSLI